MVYGVARGLMAYIRVPAVGNSVVPTPENEHLLVVFRREKRARA